MEHNTEELKSIVSELNNGFTEICFWYVTDGSKDCILFGSLVLWNSELNDREENEPLWDYVKREFNKLADILSSHRFQDDNKHTCRF